MSWLGRIFGRAVEQPRSWCDSIEPEDFKGYEGAVSLIPCAVRRGARSLAFAERVEALLAGLPVSRLSHLDRSIRDRSCWYGDWFSERSLSSVMPGHLPQHGELFLCLALCHPSGYVRQPAIREAAKRLEDGTLTRYAALALQLLVLRRNDWVAPVAAEAAAALDQLLVDGLAVCWVQALPLVHRLAHFERRDHAHFVKVVNTKASSAAWAAPLMDGIRSTDRLVSRTATRSALASTALDRVEVVRTALGAADPVVRLLAARSSREPESPDQRDALLRRLEADPFMPVRREALRLRAAWIPETLADAHERFLFDPSRALRAQAQSAIAIGDGDAAAQYRAHLRDPSPSRAAVTLLGLGEVGQGADAHLAEGFLQATLARCRAAAIRCLARLAGDQYVDTFVGALLDPSPRVCQAAATALLGRVHRAGVGRLLAVLDNPPHKHVRRVVLRLLFESDQWAPLALLVRCAAGGHEEEAPWASSLLRSWFTRHRGWPSRPPQAHVDALREAMRDCGPGLKAAQRRELEFLLSTLLRA